MNKVLDITIACDRIREDAIFARTYMASHITLVFNVWQKALRKRGTVSLELMTLYLIPSRTSTCSQ